MTKEVLADVASGFNLQVINDNFQKIETAFDEKVLYRDNPTGEPNQMENLLDMNSYRIINLPAPMSPNDAARLADIPFDPIPIGTTTALLTTFTPSGAIAATNVQTAIEETNTEIRALVAADVANLATLNANLVNPASGDIGIAVKRTATGSVATTQDEVNQRVINVFDFMTDAQRTDVKNGTLALDVTTAVQSAIDASYGYTLKIPRGGYKVTAPLVIQPIFGGTTNLPMTLEGDGFDANGGNGGTFFSVAHNGNFITMNNTTGGSADARFLIKSFAIIGPETDVSGGDGIYAKQVNHLLIKDMWIQGMGRCGVYFEKCYGSALEDVVLLRNRQWGFWANEAFNLGNLNRVRSYGNGRFYTSSVCGNIRLSGSGNENLGVVFNDVDASYSGTSAFQLFQRSNTTLTNISVTGGVATVTTASAHGRTTGENISVVGATVAPLLNTTYTVPITVTGSTTFTFATTAANGTYNEATLVVGPGAYGFFIASTRGLTLGGYVEDCIGPGLYIATDVRSFLVQGGYWQGSTKGCVIINDSAQNGKYAGMYLNGAQAKLVISVPAGPHNVDVSQTNTYASGAITSFPTLYLQDGMYHSNAAPTTGTWTRGAYVKQSTPAVASPKGWYCTVAGTPGTWVSEGAL